MAEVEEKLGPQSKKIAPLISEEIVIKITQADQELILPEKATAVAKNAASITQIYDVPENGKILVEWLKSNVLPIYWQPTVNFNMDKRADRDALRSISAKFKKLVNAAIDLGDNRAKEVKALPKIVDANRNLIKSELTDMYDALRAPLTQFEEAEKAHKALLSAKIVDVEILGKDLDVLSEQDVLDRLSKIETLKANPVTDKEFADKFSVAITVAEGSLHKALNFKREQEALRLRNEQLEKEAAEREREKQAAEAANIAKLKAEKDAENERLRLQLESEKQKAALIAAEKAKEEAEIAAEKAKAEAETAAKKAVEEERARAEAEAKKLAEAEEARKANVEHQRKINQAVFKAFTDLSLSDEQAKKVLTAIVRGEIPHVSIEY